MLSRAAFWNRGWSHGKEKLEGRPDTSKGSFYANPQFDRPFDDERLIETFPSFCHPNIWPDKEDVPGLEAAFKDLGRLMVDVGVKLSRSIDDFVKQRCPGYEAGKLHRIISQSRVACGRLLHTRAAGAAAPVPSC